jgi:myo-inositol-1(or 4)-monophosphatase|tara:strand:- start:663 stop:1454 length:792 start_codon:yes stop_codon:yes gene_type:complete
MAQSANMNVMIATARKAGRALAKDFREVANLQVSVKGAGDFVTRADMHADQVVKEELIAARPTYGFLAAERNEIEGKDPTRRWIVDAMVGATNFQHGMPHYAVTIALEHKGEIIAGVIYDAAQDECFFAEKGQGAWMNETRMRVSGRRTMSDCVFATGLPSAGCSDLPQTLMDLAQILPVSAGIRNLGAPALDLAYVAAGRVDGFWERRLKVWDMAAGLIILKEAGGFSESIHPGENSLEDGTLIAANDQIFTQLAKAVRKSS